MQFIFGVVDNQANRAVIEGAHADHVGINIILEKLSSLDIRGRTMFLRHLIGKGMAVHEPEGPNDPFQYTISAMKL